jgi:two-component system cell cycle response regulator
MIVEQPSKGTRIERRIVSMMGQFASHVALAIRNAKLLEQVQRLAETDPLTGVANRRLFELTLNRELSRASRSGEELTLVMLDVDRFKSFNDTHGHQAGDDVLRGVARALADTCRDFDTVARYGGEEFAVILPGCSAKESLKAAERFRKAISDMRAVAPITASAGVSTLFVNAADGEGLVKSADEALYESKRTGRDRTTRSRRKARPKKEAETFTDARLLVDPIPEFVAR